jgi:hypothetical protein
MAVGAVVGADAEAPGDEGAGGSEPAPQALANAISTTAATVESIRLDRFM